MRTSIKGLEVNYEIIGEGKPLLILHGWGSNSKRWQKVGELLAEIGVKVIIPDLPGFGNSDKPSTVWNLDDYCDFIQEFVKLLNLEKFYLLGHSFGGALAVKYSLRFPGKIDKLFLVSAACSRKSSFKKKLLYIISKIFKVFSFIPFIKKAFYKFIIRKSDYLDTEGIMRDIFLKIIKENLSDILSQVQVPTVIIWGEKDDVTKIKDARLINKKIKGSHLKIIPGASHDLNTKVPEELFESIKQFLKIEI